MSLLKKIQDLIKRWWKMMIIGGLIIFIGIMAFLDFGALKEVIDLTTAIAAIVAAYISYEVFRYTKLRDMPHLSVEIANINPFSHYKELYTDDNGKVIKLIERNKGHYTEYREPRLIFKNLGNEGLKAELEVYLCETEGSADTEGLTDSEICSKLKKVKPDLEITLNLQPKEIYDSYLYGVIDTCTSKKARELIEKEVNEQQEKGATEEKIKKRVREGQYFTSQKPHLVIFKGKYESSLGGGEVKEFCRSFRLIPPPLSGTNNDWHILSNNIQFKTAHPQKKTCLELLKK